MVLFLYHLAQGQLQNAEHRVPNVMDQLAFLLALAFGLFDNLGKKGGLNVLFKEQDLRYHDLILVLYFLDQGLEPVPDDFVELAVVHVGELAGEGSSIKLVFGIFSLSGKCIIFSRIGSSIVNKTFPLEDFPFLFKSIFGELNSIFENGRLVG